MGLNPIQVICLWIFFSTEYRVLKGFEALHGEVSMSTCTVCIFGLCVSTWLVDSVLLRCGLAIYSTTAQCIFGIRETSQFCKELSCFLTTIWAEGRKSAGTTTFILVDQGDFLLLTSQPRSEFLIGLNVSTRFLSSSLCSYVLLYTLGTDKFINLVVVV